MRATARLADVSFNTVAKLLIDAGKVCANLHDELVQGVTYRDCCRRQSVTPATSETSTARDRTHAADLTPDYTTEYELPS